MNNNKRLSNQELFKIVSKPWANIQDIKKIAQCGRDKATNIRVIIEDEIIKNNKKLPSTKIKYVPMQKVIDYFNIDVEYIYSMALKEKNLNS